MPPTGWQAGARGWPARGHCSSAFTAPTCATGWSDRCLAGSLGASTSSPRSREPSLPLRTAGRACPRFRDPPSFPAAPTSAASTRFRVSRHGLGPGGRYLLFPATPPRPEKRHERAVSLAASCEAELLTGGSIDPDEMPLWVHAANAVVVTSEYEGLRLACLEALACDVPVLSTPVGISSFALAGLPGTLCAPFDLETWSAAARPLLDAPDPRVAGADRAAPLSAQRMAERTIGAYRHILRAAVID